MTQEEYIEILFNDCGFTPSMKRAWLQERYGFKYADSLSKGLKSELIDLLKVMKNGEEL